MHTHPKRSSSQHGFTLVELAVSSFLIAVGLLSVYALLRTGLESSEDQEKDLRGVLFAKSTFSTLSAASTYAAQSGGSTNWVSFWEDFFNGSTNLPLVGASSQDWPTSLPSGAPGRDFSSAPTHRLLAGDGLHSWYYASLASASNTVWYDFSEPSWLPDDDHKSAIAITLHVWPKSPQSSAQTFFHIFCLEQPPEP